MSEDKPNRAWLESAAMAAAGVATFAAGVWLVEDDSEARAVLEAIGAAAVILSPFAARLEEVSLGLRGVGAKIASRPKGKEFLEKAAEATDETLLAVLPLLEEDVGVEILHVPSTMPSMTLRHEDLSFLRTKLFIEIVAIRLPDTERWIAGGKVSRIDLQPGTEMLAFGASGDLEAARARLAYVGVPSPPTVEGRSNGR